MANRNSQQRSGQYSQGQGRDAHSHRNQMGDSGQGYRGQQSAFQDHPAQFGGHYGADDNYPGSRQYGGLDALAYGRGHGGDYETNTRGDEYYNPQTHSREHWAGDSVGAHESGRPQHLDLGFSPRGVSGDYERSSATRGQHHDPDYLQWRGEQMRGLDDDYQAWREERYANFSNDFGEWRKNRKSNPPKGTVAADADGSSSTKSK